MDHHKRHPRGGGLFFGALLVLAGTAVLLSQLDLLGGYDAWDFWPAILVLAGLFRLVASKTMAGRMWAVLLLGVGTVIQLHILEVLQLEWKIIWPIGLIAFGVVILLSSFFRKKKKTTKKPSSVTAVSTDELDIKVLFGGREERIDSQAFVGGQIDCTMGGCELDLRDARMKDDTATLDVKIVMGGVEIHIPRDWSVSIQGNPVMGAFEDKTRPSRTDGPQLVIAGSALMGGVEIRN